jgi:hypothetical protein
MQDKYILSESTNTKQKGFDPLKKPEYTPNEQTYTESKKAEYVMQRRRDMDIAKRIKSREYNIFMKQFEAKNGAYSDGRAFSNVPLEFAIIELAVSELAKRTPERRFIAKKGSELQAQLIKRIREDLYARQNRKVQEINNDYDCLIFGTSVIYTGLEVNNRIIYDIDESSGDEIGFIKKKETSSNIFWKNADVRFVWFDDCATHIDDAVDCIAEQYVSYENFQNLKLDGSFKNMGSIAPEFTYGQFDIYGLNEEERSKFRSNYIKLTHYWNKVSDSYWVVANDTILVKETHILNPTHDLPLTPRQCFRNPHSMWGRGFCEILQPLKSEINNLRETLMDGVRRSSNSVIAIGNGLEFDGQKFALNNSFMKFRGQMSPANFQQITGTPPNNAAFSFMESLFSDVAVYGGLDVRNIQGAQDQTAYQTAVQKESSMQRMNNIILNRDEAYTRADKMDMQNIMQFYPRKMAREAFAIGSDGTPKEKVKMEYPKIELKDEAISNGKLLKQDGLSIIEITPEKIR